MCSGWTCMLCIDTGGGFLTHIHKAGWYLKAEVQSSTTYRCGHRGNKHQHSE